MKKAQVIAVVFAIIFVGGLYSLPRIVVDSEESGAALQESEVDESTSNINQMHDAPIAADDRARLDQLKQEISNAETGKLMELAEEIEAIFAKNGKYDSIAYYYELASDRAEGPAGWEKTGIAYYDAFTFALNEQKMNYLAEKTRNYLNKVLEKDPKRFDLKTKVAMTYVSSANPMQGITMLREVLEEDPTNADGLYNMGVLSMQSGQYKKAAERFEELVKYHPENIQGQFYLGVSYFESKQNNKAKKQFQAVQSMTQDPMILSSVESYLGRL